MDYYVTYNGNSVTIHKGENGARMNTYTVNHDIQDVEVCGDEFYAIGSRMTTTFRHLSGYSFTRTGTHLN